MFVDTHCHIQSIGRPSGEPGTRELWAKTPDLTADEVISRASASDVTKLICVGCDLPDSQNAIDFVQDRDNCFASIGIHPHEARHYADNAAHLAEFASLVTSKKVVAVGECGLDYFYGHSSKEQQLEILKFQMDLAVAHNLPLIFHVREAFEDFWPVYEQYPSGSLRGVLHSYTDTVENLERAVSHGLFIGVNGIATFTKNEAQDVMYRTIPQRLLLLETDAPFLTPHPYRGKVNEPKHIRTIAEYLAQLRGESLQSLETATTNNSKELFNF